MSSPDSRRIIPSDYKRQSEIARWLPGYEFLETSDGKHIVKQLVGRSQKSSLRKTVLGSLAGTSLLFFLIAIAWFQSLDFSKESSVWLLSFGLFVFSVVLCMSSFLLFLNKGAVKTYEPHFQSLYSGDHLEEYQRILTYWRWLQESDRPIFAEIGENGVGLAIDFKSINFGILALIGKKRDRRTLPVSLKKMIHSKSELWFPPPPLISSLTNSANTRIGLIEQIILHENDELVEKFLVKLQAIFGNENTRKSREARIRWVEALRATKANRTESDLNKRYDLVCQHIEDLGLKTSKNSAIEGISKHYNYPVAAKAIRKALTHKHLGSDPLAQHLRNQLNQ